MSGYKPLLVGAETVDVPLELYCPRQAEPCEYVVEAVKRGESDSYPFDAELVVSNCVIDETNVCAFAIRAIGFAAKKGAY